MSTSIAVIVGQPVEERSRFTSIGYAEIAAAIIETMTDYLAYLAVQRLTRGREHELLDRLGLPIDTLALRLQIDERFSFFLLQDGQLLYFYRYPNSDAIAYGRVTDVYDIKATLAGYSLESSQEDHNYRFCVELLKAIEHATILPWGSEAQNRLRELIGKFHRPLAALDPS